MSSATARPLIITIDGPSGSGKSSAAVRLALHFRIPCLDTGAMYRFIALSAIEAKISLSDESAVVALTDGLQFHFRFDAAQNPIVEISKNKGPRQILGREIRTPEVSLGASEVGRLRELRRILVEMQQKIGREKGAVVEGRDAGTVIFPDAHIKFYVTASKEERAKRRYEELLQKLGKEAPSAEDVLREMIQRDKQDEERQFSPSKPAPDAVIVDTSGLDFESVVEKLVALAESASPHKS